MPVRILIVCLGNICRSPTAEAVFAGRINEMGLSQRFEVDSAGTAAYHIGNPPDSRSQATALERGFDLSNLRARQLVASDFDQFDYILAADVNNLNDIYDLRNSRPEPGKAVVSLILEPTHPNENKELPDPYFGGDEGFSTVLDLCESAVDAWMARLS